MKRIILSYLLLSLLLPATSGNRKISSPDSLLLVNITLHNGSPAFSVRYKYKIILEESPLGLITNISNFSRNLQLVETNEQTIHKTYHEPKSKKSRIEYLANEVTCTYETTEKEQFSITFRVSNHDIAFRYSLAQNGETARSIIEKELTGFNFPSFTTTFLTPQATPMIGWMRTKPSYEEEYL
ncbi:MAG: glycoside hydrolase family 97 N-terminal domain-containing protein, partial [Proteiniphilum sp.]